MRKSRRDDFAKIRFLPLNQEVEVREEKSVLAVALSNRIQIDNSCGGSGSCGTCRVRVDKKGTIPSPRTEVESEMANDRGFEENERLACQLEPLNGLIIQLEK